MNRVTRIASNPAKQNETRQQKNENKIKNRSWQKMTRSVRNLHFPLNRLVLKKLICKAIISSRIWRWFL